MVFAQENVVQTAGLTKIFRDFWLREKVVAVDDLELAIHGREVFGLLGPNGSGKSTTLKMILGLLFPTRGTISVFGKHPTNVQVKRRIGFLPEDSHLYPFLSARETLDFYGRLFRLPRAQRRSRIDMLLEMVGLTGAAYRPVGEYSKGMQRRIGLAQALINDPDLLILDEPTSGLDPLGTRQFKDLIRTLADRGKTVLLSSHLLGDVEDVCDRVCILYGGKSRAVGSIDQLLARSGQTQLTVDELDESTLRRIAAVLDESGKDIREVTTPRDRLESLFLRIVAEAQQQRVVTGGATGGGRVAEFLTAEPEGKEVIETLITAEEPSEPVEDETSQEPAAPQVEKRVLEELTRPGGAEDEHETQKARGASEPQEQADRGLIDDLIRSDEPDQTDEGEE